MIFPFKGFSRSHLSGASILLLALSVAAERRTPNSHAEEKVKTSIRAVSQATKLIEVVLTSNLPHDACIQDVAVKVRFSDRRSRHSDSQTFKFHDLVVKPGETASAQFAYDYRDVPIAKIDSVRYEAFHCSIRFGRLDNSRSFWERLLGLNKHAKLAKTSEAELTAEMLQHGDFEVQTVVSDASVDLTQPVRPKDPK